MWPTSYWFISRPIINIIFSFTINHSPYQQFVKFFVKQFVSLVLLKKKKSNNTAINYSVRTQKSNSPSPLRTVSLYNSTQAQINLFVREWIKQQERASPEDENEEGRLVIMEYVCKWLNTSLPKEANVTQKDTLFTLFSQCS